MKNVCSKKDYGQIYFENINHKAENQKIYSLFSHKNAFENKGGLCMKLAILSSKAFLGSSSFFNYAQKLSGIQEQIKNIGNMPRRITNKDDLFKYYNHKHLILRGEDISKNLIKEAQNLTSGEKAAFILVIGNHSVSIVLENKDEKIYIGFYDPTFGQLYLETTNKAELYKSSENNYYFNHSKSILNDHNILFGKIALFQDSIIDVTMPVAFLTKIRDLKISDSDATKNKIEFSNGFAKNEALGYIGENIGMLINMREATSEKTFIDFLNKYDLTIIGHYLKFKKCVIETKNIHSHFKEIFKAQTLYNLELALSKEDYSVNGKSIVYKRGEICIKEDVDNDVLLKAEENFAKISYEDKMETFNIIEKCMAKDDYQSLYKNSEYYSYRDEYFTAIHDEYYYAKDLYSAYGDGFKEKCLKINEITELS